MKKKIEVKPIGFVDTSNGFAIKVNKEFLHGLKNISGFSHLQIVWWGNLFDSEKNRKILTSEKPYKKGPNEIGVFATRSQFRPNPVLITTIAVLNIDFENGIIYTPYIDAENNTPVLDIKPYHLIERVKECSVPSWCKHWPEHYEDAATFDWENEFNF